MWSPSGGHLECLRLPRPIGVVQGDHWSAPIFLVNFFGGTLMCVRLMARYGCRHRLLRMEMNLQPRPIAPPPARPYCHKLRRSAFLPPYPPFRSPRTYRNSYVFLRIRSSRKLFWNHTTFMFVCLGCTCPGFFCMNHDGSLFSSSRAHSVLEEATPLPAWRRTRSSVVSVRRWLSREFVLRVACTFGGTIQDSPSTNGWTSRGARRHPLCPLPVTQAPFCSVQIELLVSTTRERSNSTPPAGRLIHPSSCARGWIQAACVALCAAVRRSLAQGSG